MVNRKALLGAFVLALIVTFPPRQVSAGTASRIELKDSTVLLNITYSVDREYKVISIPQGNDKRNISFTDIAVILDAKGKDVTADVLDWDQTPPRPIDKSIKVYESSAPRPSERRLPYSFAVHAQPNFSVPIGDYYQGFTAGVGYGADITVPVSREIAIRGTVSRSGMQAETELPGNPGFSAWRYLISVEYYKWPHWRDGRNTMYYIYSGIGGISHTFSGSGSNLTETKFTTALGLGLMQKVSKNLGIEGGAELDAVYVGNTGTGYGYYGNVQYAWLLDFKFGLVLLL